MAINRAPQPKDASPLSPEEQELAQAFDGEIRQQRNVLLNSPVLLAVVAHESAGTPDEQTIFGVHGISVKLGDLKQLVNLLR